jgi:hypothetical protein
VTGSHTAVTFCIALLAAFAVTARFRTSILGPVAGAVAFGSAVVGAALAGFLQL